MASKEDLQSWIIDALNALGPASVTQIARHIWEDHEDDLKASGDLFYTWQYDMRWAGQTLQRKGKILKKGQGRTWSLNGI
jgi:hypothetical protein